MGHPTLYNRPYVPTPEAMANPPGFGVPDYQSAERHYRQSIAPHGAGPPSAGGRMGGPLPAGTPRAPAEIQGIRTYTRRPATPRAVTMPTTQRVFRNAR